jgi:hypothetical protein
MVLLNLSENYENTLPRGIIGRSNFGQTPSYRVVLGQKAANILDSQDQNFFYAVLIPILSCWVGFADVKYVQKTSSFATQGNYRAKKGC